MYHQVTKWIKEHKWIILVLFIRLCFFLSMLVCIDEADTPPFSDIDGFEIFKGRIDAMRTPVYPFVIEIFQRLFSNAAFPVLTAAQFLFSCFAILRFDETLSELGVGSIIRNVLFILYNLSVTGYGYDRYILSESLILSLTFLLISSLVSYVKTFEWQYIPLIALNIFLEIFLRPQAAIFTVILFAFYILFGIAKKIPVRTTVCACTSMAILLFCVFLYGRAYQKQYGFFGLSTTLIHQETTNIINADLYSAENAPLPQQYMDIVSFIEEYKGQYTGYEFSLSLRLADEFGHARMKEYNEEIIRNNLLSYSTERLYELIKNIDSSFSKYPAMNPQFPFSLLNFPRLLAGITILPI